MVVAVASDTNVGKMSSEESGELQTVSHDSQSGVLSEQNRAVERLRVAGYSTGLLPHVLAVAGRMTPGHQATAGTRTPPSHTMPFPQAKGPVEPACSKR